MTLSKFTLICMLFFASVQSSAYNPQWKDLSTKIEANSPLQKIIDETYVHIFNSPAQEALCTVLMNPLSLVHSLGISPLTAVQISKACKFKETIGFHTAKIMAKSYFVAPMIDANLESWTDYGNRTYLFIDSNYNIERLTRTLIHEVAIAFDAKMRMMFTGYLLYQRNKYFHQAGGFDIVTIGNLSSYEKTLQHAFNVASTTNIATTFAAMRAFSFEQIVTNEFKLEDHQTCVERFTNNYQIIKNFNGNNHSQEIDQIPGMLAEAFDKNLAPQTELEEKNTFEFLLNPELMIEDRGRSISFCQYMSLPLLTGKTTWNFFASGPRPRLTGGSGGQGNGTGNKPTAQEGFLSKIFTSKPKPYPLGNPKSDPEFQQMLQDALKIDLKQIPTPTPEQ